MKSINYKDVQITNGFWNGKQKLNREITLYSVWNRFYDTGRIKAFECSTVTDESKKPHIFWDSDVAKWIEAASYVIAKEPCDDLCKKIEYIIDCIEKNRLETGYFNSYFIVCEPENIFTKRASHELYCAGHLIEAAVAYYEATGKDRFLNIMEQYVDCIYKSFVTDKTPKFTTGGHEEIELALIRMYRCTGHKKCYELARFFLMSRGANDKDGFILSNTSPYAQDHAPIHEQTTAEGHAVRACYLYSAMADLAKEDNDGELFNACRTIFDDIVKHKMYITGGIGSTHIGETFTIPYDLPNEKAYAETCAAIGMMFFAQRMMAIENDSRYADIIEREMYNGMLSGLSLDGKAFFYENPLEINLANHGKNVSTKEKERYPITQRKEVFECSCCPPNINRLFASMGSYIYATDEGSVYVNQFIGSEADVDGMYIRQQTNYPADGHVTIMTRNVKRLMIRIPSWCDEYTINAAYKIVGGYAAIENPSEYVEVDFAMKPFLIETTPEVRENINKVAVQMGPMVYCSERCDNKEMLHSLYIDKNLQSAVRFNEKLGVNVISAKGYVKVGSGKLYSRLSENFEDTTIELIPYFAFANRGETDMLVWHNYR